MLITRKNVLVTKRIYEGQVLNLRVDELSGENNKSVTREVVEHNGGVVIICQPTPDKVVLINQYRYSIDRELLELPAGRLEQGEIPLAAAQRELAEETGYFAYDWKDLGRVYSAPGFCDEILYFYLASRVVAVERNLDEDEEIDVIVVPLLEAWHMALSTGINDAKTIAGLSFLLRELWLCKIVKTNRRIGLYRGFALKLIFAPDDYLDLLLHPLRLREQLNMTKSSIANSQSQLPDQSEGISLPLAGAVVMALLGAIVVGASFYLISYWPLPASVSPMLGFKGGACWGAAVGALSGLVLGFLTDDSHFS